MRRRAWELGIDLSSVTGTGPAGRITQADLDAHVQQRGASQTSAPADPRYAQRTAEEVIPVIGLRRKIAQKMQEAKRRIPHFTYVEEIDVTELEDLRTRLNTQYGATPRHAYAAAIFDPRHGAGRSRAPRGQRTL